MQIRSIGRRELQQDVRWCEGGVPLSPRAWHTIQEAQTLAGERTRLFPSPTEDRPVDPHAPV